MERRPIMFKRLLIITLGTIVLFGMTSIVMAGPHQGNPGSDFVCPVIKSGAVGAHNPVASPLGNTGTYTVVPQTSQANHLNVPDHATNGNGSGVPGGPQSAPSDTDYTAIWNGD